PSHDMDEVFKTSLQQLGEFLRLDRLVLVELAVDGHELKVTYAWQAPGGPPLPQVIQSQDFPWVAQQLFRGQSFVFSHLYELPAEAARDQESFRQWGIKSLLAIPLVAGGQVFGALGFATVAAEHVWSEALVQRLELVAGVFANALARKKS